MISNNIEHKIQSSLLQFSYANWFQYFSTEGLRSL